LLENESKVIKNKSLYVGDMIKMDVPNKPRKRMTETPCHLDRSWFKSSQSLQAMDGVAHSLSGHREVHEEK
jgi:hypothetical protein